MAKVSAGDLQTLNKVIQKWIDLWLVQTIGPKAEVLSISSPVAALVAPPFQVEEPSCHAMKDVQINFMDNAGRRGRTGLAFRGAERFCGRKEGYCDSDF